MARALALDPEMILYDEPFTGQDPVSMGVLVKLIHDINRTLGTTSVIVSHDVEETCSIADYVYMMVLFISQIEVVIVFKNIMQMGHTLLNGGLQVQEMVNLINHSILLVVQMKYLLLTL